MKRYAFTLVELLVAMSIIAILGALSLGGLHMARESARKTKTRSTVTKISQHIDHAWEEFRVRRVPMKPTGTDRCAIQKLLWNARRDMLRLEMPDRWSDVFGGPLVLPEEEARGKYGRYQAVYNNARTELLARDLDDDGVPDLTPEEVDAMLASVEQSECLFMVVTAFAGRAPWRPSEIGDTDDDGLPEFVDGWGNPIAWLRWPAGYPAADPMPINYSPAIGIQSLGPRPLILSAGPVGEYGVNRGLEPDPDPANEYMTYRYMLDFNGDLNPWTLDEAPPFRQIGEQTRDDAHDNLTNYD